MLMMTKVQLPLYCRTASIWSVGFRQLAAAASVAGSQDPMCPARPLLSGQVIIKQKGKPNKLPLILTLTLLLPLLPLLLLLLPPSLHRRTGN